MPFPAGGGIDTVIRILGPKMSESLGQQLIIDNRAGASGTLGTEVVAKSAPDGYTLLGTFSSHSQNQILYRSLPFDTVRDFASITVFGTVPNILVSNPSLPVKSVKELVALAKRRPGDILYASIGPASPSHLTAELFNSMAGVKTTHVPYKGAAPSLVALVSGETQITFTTVLVAVPYLKANRLRALAVTSLKRSSALPEVPTLDEAGIPGFDSTAWWGLLAPAKTPKPIIDRLYNVTTATMKLPEIRARLDQLGAEPAGHTPEAFDQLIRDDIAKWGKVVKALGITAD
ncbi:MAG: tripartite tricarboxylate transporter substrate binding protein [Burkholderiales bacterium]|nr:tripartite tricarboxylate transporter substrate binding protein [Burkholderiales bacterium]